MCLANVVEIETDHEFYKKELFIFFLYFLSFVEQERKKWLNNTSEFAAKPMRKSNGSLDMYKWRCIIPGRKNTSWEGGFYKLEMTFQVSLLSKQELLWRPSDLSSTLVCTQKLLRYFKYSDIFRTYLYNLT